jgi:CHAT domain-containing protein
VSDLLTRGREALQLATRDPAASQRLCDSVLQQAQREGAWDAVAVAERARGVAAMTLNAIEDAVTHLRAAVAAGRRAGSSQLTGEARMSLAFALALRGSAGQAVRQIDLAIDELEGVAAARAHVQRAAILQQFGRDEAAFADLRIALPSLKKASDAEWQARAYSNRSLMHLRRDSYAAAEADLVAALTISLEHGFDVTAAYAEHNLGVVKAQRGDIPAALRLFESAEQRYRELGVIEPALWHAQAEALVSVRLLDEANDVLEAAITTFHDNHRASDLPQAHLQMSAVQLLRGNVTAARVEAQRARKGYRSLGDSHSDLLAQYALARADMELGRRRATAARVVRIADQLEELGWVVPALEARVFAGRVALQAGDLVSAHDQLALASKARSFGTAGARTQAWLAEALLRAADGNRRGAYAALGAGLRIVEEYQATLGATELRVHVGGARAELAKLGLRMSFESAHARQALAWAERARGVALLMRSAMPSADPELAQDLSELRRTVADIEEARRTGAPDAKRLELRQRRIEQRIRAHSRALSGDTSDGYRWHDPLPELREALRDRHPGTVLVEFVEVDDQIAAITIVDGRVTMHALASVSEAAQAAQLLGFAFRRLVRAGEHRTARHGALRASADTAAIRLDRLVLHPLSRLLADHRLVIVPSETLQSVPWSALPSCRGRPVTVSPSAVLWLRATRRDRMSSGRTVVISGPGLPGATSEARAVATLYPTAELIEGSAATAGTVLRAMQGADLVHLACHGRLRSDNPLFSSLSLGDGPLTVYDLEQQSAPPRHIVLAGCNTAIAHTVAADEVIGAAAALLTAGTSTLVASVLAIPDLAAVNLMTAYHKALRAGMSPSVALAEVQGSVESEDPAVIAAAAGFICMGRG